MRSVFVILVMSIGLGCAAEPASPVEEEAALSTSEAAQGVTTKATGVWHLDGIENCFDLYQRPCSTSTPPRQCPTAVEGQPCELPPNVPWCGRRITNSVFQLFRCF